MMLAIEFGSSNRGDYDVSSDRDLLLLASDWKEIADETIRRRLKGFSVSSFLLDKATYLVRTGNLFFKHIVDEGTLVAGCPGKYRQLISQWQPARCYDHEIEENLDLLEVLDFLPSSPAGLVATVDILITSIRNILIRRLANHGKFIFAWTAVFATAQEHGMIKKEDVLLFLTARHLKNQYRQGDMPHVSLSYLERLMEGAQRAFGIVRGFRFAGRKAIRSLPERFHDGTYKQLRALELVCAEYGVDASLSTLLAWIRQPSYFCANGPNRPMKPTH